MYLLNTDTQNFWRISNQIDFATRLNGVIDKNLISSYLQVVPQVQKISNLKNFYQTNQIHILWVKTFLGIQKFFKNFDFQILLFEVKVFLHSVVRFPMKQQLSTVFSLLLHHFQPKLLRFFELNSIDLNILGKFI